MEKINDSIISDVVDIIRNYPEFWKLASYSINIEQILNKFSGRL